MYNLKVVFTWDEPKRQANLAEHGKADGNETDLYYQNVGYL